MTHTPQEHKLANDTMLTTASGATFTASKNWYATTQSDMIVLEEPDRELTVALIENSEPTAQQAVEKAWKQFRHNFKYPIVQTAPDVAKDGWDQFYRTMIRL